METTDHGQVSSEEGNFFWGLGPRSHVDASGSEAWFYTGFGMVVCSKDSVRD